MERDRLSPTTCNPRLAGLSPFPGSFVAVPASASPSACRLRKQTLSEETKPPKSRLFNSCSGASGKRPMTKTYRRLNASAAVSWVKQQLLEQQRATTPDC